MKTMLVSIALALIAVTAVHAATPVLIPYSCPGGGQGWTVFEDKNGDGNFDWQTTRKCDGSIYESSWPPPAPPPDPRGVVTTSPPASIDFSYQSCESYGNSWTVTEKDGSNNPTAYIQMECNGSLTISYPQVFRPDTRGERKILPNQPDQFEDNQVPFSLFPNPTMLSVNLSAELEGLNESDEYEVSVVDVQGRTRFLVRVKGRELLKDYPIDVALIPPGTYTVQVKSVYGTKLAQKPLSIVK